MWAVIAGITISGPTMDQPVPIHLWEHRRASGARFFRASRRSRLEETAPQSQPIISWVRILCNRARRVFSARRRPSG
jgi:hypothetical protein